MDDDEQVRRVVDTVSDCMHSALTATTLSADVKDRAAATVTAAFIAILENHYGKCGRELEALRLVNDRLEAVDSKWRVTSHSVH
jgi:hypothetical protein